MSPNISGNYIYTLWSVLSFAILSVEYQANLTITVAQPILCFGILGRPPYFFLDIAPQRLAWIRHIQLDYVETNFVIHGKRCQKTGSLEPKCTNCNLGIWLRLTAKSLPGLRTLDMFVRLRPGPTDVPSVDHPWVVDLYNLQAKSKAVRKFEISLESEGQPRALPSTHTGMIKVFESDIRNRLDELRQLATVSDQQLEV